MTDSALYTEETIQSLTEQNQLFITRVPQKLKEAKAVLAQACAVAWTMRQQFACDKDAHKALQQWLDKQEFIHINEVKIIRHDKRTKRGRPGLNDEVITTFQITGCIATHLKLCAEAQQTNGLFILGTNDLSEKLSMQFLLDEYKSQQYEKKTNSASNC
jgi:transposase